MTKRANGAFLALALGVGCGASEVRVGEPASPSTSALPDANAAVDAAPVLEPVASSPAAPPERPFATTPAEAKRLIKAQLYAHVDAVQKCLVDYLVKNNMGGGETVDFAIDETGTLVGVVVWGAKDGGKDPELKACMTIALQDAMFPKSRSGIITVQQAEDGF